MKWGASLLAALVVGLAGGYAIRYFSSPKIPTRFAFNPATGSGFPGGGGGFAGRTGGFATVGKVASVSGSTLQVQGSNGETTVKVAGTTTITRTVKASASSIAVGMCVTAIGPTSSIGTVSATRLVLSAPGPNGCTVSFRGGPGGG